MNVYACGYKGRSDVNLFWKILALDLAEIPAREKHSW